MPLVLSRFMMPSAMGRPPPQATTQFVEGWPDSMNWRSSWRKVCSPLISLKISLMDLPEIFSISRSESRKCMLSLYATLRATVDLPTPMKPIR